MNDKLYTTIYFLLAKETNDLTFQNDTAEIYSDFKKFKMLDFNLDYEKFAQLYLYHIDWNLNPDKISMSALVCDLKYNFSLNEDEAIKIANEILKAIDNLIKKDKEEFFLRLK